MTIIDPKGNVIVSVEYEDAPKNQSLNLADDNTYVWSIFVSPGEVNIIKEGAVKGAMLPRTGRDNTTVNDWAESFVFLSIFCYIMARLNNNQKINFYHMKTKQLSLF